MNVLRAAVLGLALSAAACGGNGSGSTTTAGDAGAGANAASPAPGSGNPAPRMSRTPDSQPANGPSFTGSVVETMNAGGYTYLHLQGSSSPAGSDVWIAAPQFDAHKGEQISASLDMPMHDFTSPTLNRKFPLIYFVQEVGRDGQPLRGISSNATAAASAAAGSASMPRVEKTPPPPGGLSIAEVFAKKSALSGTRVTVRGTVVKFTGNVLDRNWFHIEDGSGTAAAHDNDLTVTSDVGVKIGDVVTASGILGTDRDFGIGYAYDAILEGATVTSGRD